MNICADRCRFKQIKPAQGNDQDAKLIKATDSIIPRANVPFEIDDGEDSDASGTIVPLNDPPLREATPSRLNSPTKPGSTSEPDGTTNHVDQNANSEAKERTMALAAMLESKIATKSQSDLTPNDGSFVKKRKMKFLGRGAPSRNNSLEDSYQASSKTQDAADGSQEILASQKLEYEDQAMKRKREKFKAALTEEPDAVAEEQPKIGRTRRRRL
jgi:hypothetical protein